MEETMERKIRPARASRAFVGMACGLVLVAGGGCWRSSAAARSKALADIAAAPGVTLEQPQDYPGTLWVQRGGAKLLVFVHGYNGDALTTWGGILPGLAHAGAADASRDLAAYDVLSFDYESELLRTEPIESVANVLEACLQGIALGSGRYASVTLVAHSMGGLVVERWLLNQILRKGPDVHARLREQLTTLVYLDTPHDALDLTKPRGETFEGVAKDVLRHVVRLAGDVEQLQAGSAFRQALEGDWNDARRLQPDLTKEFFVDRSFLFVANPLRDVLAVVGPDQPYRHFRHERGRAQTFTVSDAGHMELCKSSKADVLAGRGRFHELIVPLLRRNRELGDLPARPFGIRRSVQPGSPWIYAVISER